MAWYCSLAVFQLDIRYGMGKHLWDVSLSDWSPHFLLMWTLSAVTYTVTMVAIKFSILMMYRRLFPVSNFGIHWWLVTLFTFGYSTGGIVASICSCIPIQSTW